VTHYSVLGVDSAASPAEIRRAYLALARAHHPDRAGGDATIMRAVNDAWAALGDPGQRARYDRSLGGRRPAWPGGDEPLPVRHDADDLRADLADDTPFGGRVVLPRWMSLLPVAAFAASIGLFVVGLTFGSTPAIAMSVAVFMASCALFLAAPFVALLTSRRSQP
jgi:hypothetical protein